MKYIELLQSFGNNPLISLSEIKKVFPGFHSRRLHEWQQKGYIEKLSNGFYLWTGRPRSEKTLFFFANRIYRPSYISLWSALAWHGLIPEGVMQIYSITTLKTRSLESKSYSFVYRNIKPELFWGYGITQPEGQPILLAEPEKALLDTFYLETNLKTAEDLNALRLNPVVFKEIIKPERLQQYGGVFNTRVQKLVEVVLSQIL